MKSDCVVFAFPQILVFLIKGHLRLKRTIFVGIVATALSISVSVVIDSILWNRLLWPELQVFLFNVVDNRSSEWGTSPFFAYFTNFLPKALLVTAIFIPFGFFTTIPSFHVLKNAKYRLNLNPVAIELGIPAIVSVLLYSFLPHKEIRFLFPVLLPLNALSVMGMSAIRRRFKTNMSRWFPILLFAVTLVVSLGATLAFVYASMYNYSGGWALHRFHQLAPNGCTVHIDNLAATTGVSRFGESPERAITYDKTEGLTEDRLRQRECDYLIHESIVSGFQLLDTIYGFREFDINAFPPKLRLTPQLYILKKI